MFGNKVIRTTIIIACMGLAQFSMAADGLVGYWSFDEGAGDTAIDGSGNGNDGVINGGPTWVEGQLGSALDFDGTNSSVSAPHIPLDNRSFTIGMWVNLAQNTAQHVAFAQVQTQVQTKDDATNKNLIIRLGGSGHPAPGGIVMGFFYNDLKTDGGLLELNIWYHLGFVYDIDAQQKRIYLNGELVGENASTPFLGTSGDTRIGMWKENYECFSGMIDDVQLYHNALTQGEIQSIMTGLGNPNMATTPNPANYADDVLRDSDLSWVPGENTSKHHLYVGESFEEVDSMIVPTAADLDTNSLDVGPLTFGQTYYWRVDEVNGAPDFAILRGNVWSFTVEPYSIQIAGSEIIATASSATNEESLPENTLNGLGLDANDMHAITTETMWFTAMGDATPWIQYEFDGVKKLDTMTVWNSNSPAESVIGYGVKGVLIEYSVDGQTWEEFEDVNEFSRAPGFCTYNQYDEINLGGLAAKMVRLTIQSNWGGVLAAYSLSEVQFSMIPAAARTPEPDSGSVDILPDVVVSWRAGREAVQSTVYVSTDPNEVVDGLAPSMTSNTNSVELALLDLHMGETYYWRVDEVNEAEAPSVWAGPVWSFSTVTALVVDDFERYTNESPNRPFQTWLDGIGYSADEFFPAGYGGNGTGAGIGHDIWTVASTHYNGDIMETSITVPGSGQSMPFYYSNTGSVASQTERTFAVPQNWTVNGIKTLVINLFGVSGNTGQLFLRINNTKVLATPDVVDIQKGRWQLWPIDLSSVNANLENVTSLTIGVENASASGLLYVDDILLYARDAEYVTPTEPDAAKLLAYYGFNGNANDSSGNGMNGEEIGGPVYGDGVDGQALQFDGVDEYVAVPDSPGLNTTDAITIAAWIYREVDSGTWERIISRSDSSDYDYWLQITSSDSIGAGFIDAGGTARDLLDFTPGMPIPLNQWTHLAFVYDGASVKAYVNGLVDKSQDIGSFSIRTSTRPLWFGRLRDWYNFSGLIDEARIYSSPLSLGEVGWLAGLTEPMVKPF